MIKTISGATAIGAGRRAASHVHFRSAAYEAASHVHFRSAAYEAAHGKMPRGRGTWAFDIRNAFYANRHLSNMPGEFFETFYHNGTYAEARQAAYLHLVQKVCKCQVPRCTDYYIETLP